VANLKKYNKKRNFDITNEPKGTKKTSTKKLKFVVQHHIARKDHYDLRLELDGVMLSWAVPKGPSYNTLDKRLAVHVEDHPLSYRNFEGTIPKGEYGAGTVMVWDRGFYEPIENPRKTFNKGYLKFRLLGKKLKGAWTLIKFKDNNWLLIKENDGVKGYKNISELDKSVKTKRTMDEIAGGVKKSKSEELDEIEITNPLKQIFNGITKKEVIEYYQKVSNRMLPYIENRLLSTVRCPDGINGETFFKKHFKENKYLGIVSKKNKDGKRETFYYIKDKKGLIFESQMNSIEFHISGGRVKSRYPDMMIFDLDPDETLDLDNIRNGVRDLKSILEDLGLKPYLKTSGGKGYHVVVFLDIDVTWKKFRKIARDIAKLMEEKWPDKYTSNMRIKDRKDKIFIDWVRNTEGASCIAPYSLRIREGAPVSMPIKWSELDKIKPNEINIKKALKMLNRKDPWGA